MFAFGHLFIGWLVGLFVGNIRGRKLSDLSWGILLFGSLLPDIDYLFDFVFNSGIHRTLTHSIFFLAVAFIVCYFVLKFMNLEKYSWLFALGIFSHIVVDMFWPMGVTLFWPLLDFISINFISNSVGSVGISRAGLLMLDSGFGVIWLSILFLQRKIKLS
jgi:membrane-bound metal-dependent hydrolase YbcI (DUF457 family)